MVVTLTLFMIVKNESSIIERCLDSVRPLVDHIVITDTGSTDDTVDRVKGWLKRNEMRGHVFQDEWKDFGTNRTRSFQNMKTWWEQEGIDLSNAYGLTIDADMCLVWDSSTPFTRLEWCQHPGWMLKQCTRSLEYWNTRVMKGDVEWKCVGVTHEYWHADGVPQPAHCPFLIISDLGDGGCKADKFERDIRLLLRGLEHDPSNSRYQFYLANSYRDHGEFRNAIRYYERRIQSGGWKEEMFASYLFMGDCYSSLQEYEKAQTAWWNAFEVCPQRGESLCRMVTSLRKRGMNQQAWVILSYLLRMPYPQEMILFVEKDVYHWKRWEECSIVAYYADQKEIGRRACEYLAYHSHTTPDHARALALQNEEFYVQRIPATFESDSSVSVSVPVSEPCDMEPPPPSQPFQHCSRNTCVTTGWPMEVWSYSSDGWRQDKVVDHRPYHEWELVSNGVWCASMKKWWMLRTRKGSKGSKKRWWRWFVYDHTFDNYTVTEPFVFTVGQEEIKGRCEWIGCGKECDSFFLKFSDHPQPIRIDPRHHSIVIPSKLNEI